MRPFFLCNVNNLCVSFAAESGGVVLKKMHSNILREEVPLSLQKTLGLKGIDSSKVLIGLFADIGISPETFRFGNWMVLTSKELLIFDVMGMKTLLEVPISNIKKSRTSQTVGSTLIQVLIGSEWIDCARFSNRLKYRFEKVVYYLEKLKKDEDPALQEDPSVDFQCCGECGIRLGSPSEFCPKCIDRGAALSRVTVLLSGHWKSAFVIILLLILGVGLDMVWPLLTRFLVDHVLSISDPNQIVQLRSDLKMAPKNALLFIVGALGFVHISRGLVNILTGMVSSRVGNLMTFEIRNKLVKKLKELGLSYYSKHETGSLVGRVAYDTEAIHGFISQITSGFLMQFLLVVISFGMMFSLEPHLALYAMIPAPFVVFGAFGYWRYVHPRFEKLWDRSSRQAAVLNGILSGIRVVKAFGQEDTEMGRFQGISAEVRDSRSSVERTGSLFYPAMAIVFQIGGWVIWYVGGRNVLGGQLSLGTLMAFFGYLSMFYGPLSSLTQLTTWLTEFSTQIHRIFEILDTPVYSPPIENSTSTLSLKGDIEFRNVSFGYHPGRLVIKDFNLKIRAGERIGIIGRSGSGKSSLANLLCRFYEASSGEILLDGIDIRQISRQELRKNMSIVLQEPFLFSGTLAENIAYGCPDADLKKVIEVSRAANAHEFIMQRPFAYDTQVGERGNELSGGERQRISIARALLCAPSILILDEATSSIDTESELAVQSAIDEVTRDRTTIIIAHRLSTLLRCHRILVLEEGRIVESGDHWALLQLQGRYAKWVRMQQLSTESHFAEKDLSDSHLESDSPQCIHWLDPKVASLSRGLLEDLRCHISNSSGGSQLHSGVFPLRCFPIHHPKDFVSIRRFDERGQVQEVGMIEDPTQWPESSANLLRGTLERRYLFHRVSRVYSIRRFSHFLAVSACTEFGDSEFLIRNSRNSARKFGKRGRLILDVEENVYMIPDLEKIPVQDREVFSRFVHWE